MKTKVLLVLQAVAFAMLLLLPHQAGSQAGASTPPKVSRVIRSFLTAEAAIPTILAIPRRKKGCTEARSLLLSPRGHGGSLDWKRWDLEDRNRLGRVTLTVTREQNVPGQPDLGQRQRFKVKYAIRDGRPISTVCAVYASTFNSRVEFLEPTSRTARGVEVVDPVLMFDRSQRYIQELHVYLRPRR